LKQLELQILHLDFIMRFSEKLPAIIGSEKIGQAPVECLPFSALK
jgi:hypothetical protein